MLRRKLFASVAFVLAVTTLVLGSGVAYGQGSKSVVGGNALKISPVRYDLRIKPGETKSVDVYVENLTTAPASLHGMTNDFMAGDDETGNPKILLDEDSFAPSHGLKRYVAPIGDIVLQPKEQKRVKVTITIPANAAGGGYFGAIRFVPSSTNSNQQVSLSASVGTLVLVTVPGDIKEDMTLESFNVAKEGGKATNFVTNGKGLQAVARFKNSGNVQLSPFGKVTLKKSGKVIATYELNNVEPRGSALPDSIRRFSADLDNKANTLGKYTIEGNFGYGTKGQLLTASTTFYVVPLPFVIIGLVLLAGILLALFVFPRIMKAHDRRLLRKMGKRSKK